MNLWRVLEVHVGRADIYIYIYIIRIKYLINVVKYFHFKGVILLFFGMEAVESIAIGQLPRYQCVLIQCTGTKYESSLTYLKVKYKQLNTCTSEWKFRHLLHKPRGLCSVLLFSDVKVWIWTANLPKSPIITTIHSILSAQNSRQ